jgi:hypothetical protein
MGARAEAGRAYGKYVSLFKVELRAKGKCRGDHGRSDSGEVLMGGEKEVGVVGIHNDLGSGEPERGDAADGGSKAHS